MSAASSSTTRSQRSTSSISPFRSRKSPAPPPPYTKPTAARPVTPSSSTSSRPPSKLSVSPATSASPNPSPSPPAPTLERPVDVNKSKENVTVTVRFRPLSAREINKGDEIAWYADGDYTVRNEYNSSITYGFDRVFGPATTTRHVYDVAAQQVVSGVMQGINGTVFAYGVTSSGKTHTMHGEQKSPGIIPLAVKDVFGIIQETPGREFLLRVSYLEIYNEDYGHRVRLATHSNFKEFVLTAGLEFYPLGGDPKVLAGYMVKNKGFLPSGPSEIPIQRNQMKDIIYSLLSACRDPDIDTGVAFKADAIIANPPAYGHTHVAEALKVPIHIFFTMPWTPTSEFPHPLSRVKQQAGYRLSYQIVDSLIWLGIRDMINDVRKKKLKLRPVTYLSGSQGSDSDIPHGYIWSPHLVPKPKDWGPKVDVVGFCFLDLASNYEPPESLVKWLEAGEKPIYIGFGSLPVEEPEKMTQIIVEALEITKQRGIINKGWGGLGNLAEPKDSIYLLDNCPHDWLFLQCKAVVHHGGAGTTAAGLRAACPTTIVPFFGDQPFWGDRVNARGVGPPPIPIDEFTLPKLVEAINFMLDPKVKERAVELAKAMENEDGVTGAVKAFFKHLPFKKPEPEPEPVTSSFFSLSKCFGCA